MSIQITRRDFLKLCGASSVATMLAACGVAPMATPAPTQTPLSTSTPLPNATPTFTNTPAPTSTATAIATATREPAFAIAGLNPDQYPSARLANAAIAQYAQAMNLKPESIALKASPLKSQQNNSFIIAITDDATPLLIYDSTSLWQESTLRTLAENSGIQIGTTTARGDTNYRIPTYKKTLTSEFDFTGVESFEKWWNFGSTDYWLNVALENNLSFRFRGVFFHHDSYPKETYAADQNGAREFMKYRIRKFMQYVKKNRGKIQMAFHFANEPFAVSTGKLSKGQILWIGEYADKYYGPFHAFYNAFGRDWIIEAYMVLYDVSVKEFGLTPGKDFGVIGLILPGAELPGQLNAYMMDEVVRTKKEIGRRLNIPWEEVAFDIGEEFQLGDTMPEKNRLESIPTSKIDKDVIVSTLKAIAEKTKSRIHITDLDALGDDDKPLANAMATVVDAAIKSGVVPSIMLFRGLNFNSRAGVNNEDWPSNAVFLPPDHRKGQLYYGLARGFYRALTKP